MTLDDEGRTETQRPSAPEFLTKAGIEFTLESIRLAEFDRCFLQTSIFVRKHVGDIMRSGWGITDTERLIPDVGEQIEASKRRHFLDMHWRVIGEALFVRSVDNFLRYLADLLSLIFVTMPETLRSNEQVSLDFILQHSTLDDLVGGLASQKVEKLSRGGTGALFKYFRDSLGFELTFDKAHVTRIVELVEIRNILVHNRGVISTLFKRRLPGYPAEVGQRVRIERDYAGVVRKALLEAVFDIDKRAIEKWGLPVASGIPRRLSET